jgi:hypothetical protein
LDQRSLDLLKTEAEELRQAGLTKDILAWSPLIGLIGENNAPHAAVSILQSNWDELAKSFSAVDKKSSTRLLSKRDTLQIQTQRGEDRI